MKKVIFLLFFVIGMQKTYAQVIRIDNGISISSFYAGPKNIISYSVFGGINYWEHKWFSLSSEIGYIRQGGKVEYSIPVETEDNLGSWTTEYDYNKYDYLQLNTTFRLNTPTYPLSFYVGFGPRLNFLLSSDKIGLSPTEDESILRKAAIGAKVELGFNHEMQDNKFVFGMNVDYEFGNDIKPERAHFDTFRLMLSVGYRLSKR